MQSRRLVPALVLAGACALAVAGTAAAGTSKPVRPAAPAAAAAAGKPVPSTAPALAARPPRGYTLVSSPVLDAPDQQQTHGSVSCPAGLAVLGGMAFIQSSSTEASINSSYPIAGGWAADVNNAGGFDTAFEVEAFCARTPRNYSIVQGTPVDNPSGTQVGAFVTCPTGSKPLSGGALSNTFDLFTNMNTSIPAGRNWDIFENNASADDANVTAFAVCGKLGGYTVAFGNSVLDPPNSQTLSFATCPAPTVPIGAGAFSSSSSVGVNINAIGPNGSTIDSFMNNASGVSFFSATDAICAGS
jgi:hypothetical protein